MNDFTIQAGPSIGLVGVRNTSAAEGAALAFDGGWLAGVDWPRARFGRPGGSPVMYAVLTHKREPRPVAILIDLTIAAATANPADWPSDWTSSALAYMASQDPGAARRELVQLESGRKQVLEARRSDDAAGLGSDVLSSVQELPETIGAGVGRVAGAVTGVVGKVVGESAAGFLRGLGPWFTVALLAGAALAVVVGTNRVVD